MLSLHSKRKMVESFLRNLSLSTLSQERNCQQKCNSWEMTSSWLNQLNQQISFGKTDIGLLKIISRDLSLSAVSFSFFSAFHSFAFSCARCLLFKRLTSTQALIVLMWKPSMVKIIWMFMLTENTKHIIISLEMKNQCHLLDAFNATAQINRQF